MNITDHLSTFLNNQLCKSVFSQSLMSILKLTNLIFRYMLNCEYFKDCDSYH